MHYFGLLTHIPAQKGKKKLSLTFEPSFRGQALLFEFYRNQDEWKVYWIQTVEPMQIVFDRLHQRFPGAKWDEIKGNTKTFEELCCLHPVHSCAVPHQTAAIVQKICDNGLPDLVYKPCGLDGIVYRIELENGKEYCCWHKLPTEWEILRELIVYCVARAGVNPAAYEPYDQNRKFETEDDIEHYFQSVAEVFKTNEQ